MSYRPAVSRARRLLAVLSGLTLVAVMVGEPAASAATPTPTAIASAVTSDVAAPCGPPACAVPAVIVAANQPFNLTVTLTASGVPAAFKQNTTLTLTATGPGTLTPSTVVMPANTSQFTFTGLKYSTYANAVTVTA